ncbi:MAG TPA: DUF72 domain-containing protein [Thermoanaerobaculia bacterium]|nr:DUF72 domain-containing protein [Thermoanaerobaculia bacterium]
MAQIHVGTSGWHYKHWIGRYYPDDIRPARMLDSYARDFDTVEINNTFYHLPDESAFDAWRDSVPARFVFAIKGSRFLTHRIKLKDPERGLSNFLPRIERLGRKLGPVLWQLPPRWNANPERLAGFLELLPRGIRSAFEFRNESWMTQEILAILRRFNAAFCIYELAGYRSPLEITADWTYVRLHGPTPVKYQGSYSEAQLQEWAARIGRWRRRLEAVYVYFDNDDSAYAVKNALALKRLTAGGSRKAAAGRGTG